MNFFITNDLFNLSFSICATSELYLNYKWQFGSPQLFFILYKLPINNLPEKEDPPKCFGNVYKKNITFSYITGFFLKYLCNISSIMTNVLRKYQTALIILLFYTVSIRKTFLCQTSHCFLRKRHLPCLHKQLPHLYSA